ncbi:hypothetical protein J973_4055, partial [Acinetobacter baumannii 26016_7]
MNLTAKAKIHKAFYAIKIWCLDVKLMKYEKREKIKFYFLIMSSFIRK